MKSALGIYSTPARTDVSPEVQVLRLASGHLAAQAVYVFTVLGLADLLRERPRTSDDLAEKTGTNAVTMIRLLRFLETLDVVVETEAGSFVATALGKTLSRQSFSLVRNSVLLMGSPGYWGAIGGMRRNIETGECAFEAVHDMGYFSYLTTHPEEAVAFDATMSAGSEMALPGILAAYDFSSCRRVVDVGGGTGVFLQALLRKYAHIHGVLFDSDDVVMRTKADPDVSSRFTCIGGTFFGRVPGSGDTYILRRVLHDWNDQKAREILRACRRAMPDNAKLLVIEAIAVSREGGRNDWPAISLLMMLVNGGRERNETELRKLLHDGGFMTMRIVETPSGYWVVEAIPGPLP